MSAPLKTEERESLSQLLLSDPPTWMEHNFHIPDPRNPTTGALLQAGPIILHPIQERLLRAALLKIGGRFRYSTILWSTIKKSGKTRIGAGVGAWYAATQGSHNEVYCMANDGKQSSDRILSAIKQSVTLNDALNWRCTKTMITLPNGTYIEAIPCDPTGQSGSNPGMTLWSEMWGYRHEHKERLYAEMTIPPTRWGYALRWVESYAGYEGESNVLWKLYDLGVNQGYRHPAFPDLPVYVNDRANMFCYWDEGDVARRMPWQTEEYYRQEAANLPLTEFNRLHRNKWVQSIDKALPVEWWDKCKVRVPPLDKRTNVVMGVDASVNGACCSCSLVSRDPKHPKKQTLVRAVRVWKPPEGGSIDLTETIGNTVREWVDEYNVVEVAYDKYQLHKMMTDFRRGGLAARLFEFGQVTPRYVADKQLYDMIRVQEIGHDGNAVLREHVDNAMAKTDGDKFRFVSPDSGRGHRNTMGRDRPIDALVAVSMANAECLRLIL